MLKFCNNKILIFNNLSKKIIKVFERIFNKDCRQAAKNSRTVLPSYKQRYRLVTKVPLPFISPLVSLHNILFPVCIFFCIYIYFFFANSFINVTTEPEMFVRDFKLFEMFAHMCLPFHVVAQFFVLLMFLKKVVK